jgi:hypothetical protein
MIWLTDLADGLRARGLTVVEVEGWKTRGVTNQNPPHQKLALAGVRGVLWHHTATNRGAFAHNDAPTLNLCTHGRSDLPGPLCQIVFGRTGIVYVIAAGLGNHAGAGGGFGITRDMGNWELIGIEMESSGVAPWDWTDDQLRIAPYLGAALMDMYGTTLNIGHMEYSSGGKIDPAGWPGGMDGLRAQITAVSGSAAIAPGAPDSPQIIIDEPKEEDDMFTEADRTALTDLLARVSTTNGNVLEQGDLTRKDLAVVHQTIIQDVGGQLGNIKEGVDQDRAINVDALALELAGKLEEKDLSALADKLTIRVKGA